MNILNKIGLFTVSQYRALDSNYQTVMGQFREMRARYEETCVVRDNAIEAGNTIPYEFDRLIGMYTDEQMNCMFYKLITVVRNNPSKRHLLERWQKRVNDAKTSLNNVRKQKQGAN